MISISLTDLQLITELSEISEFELIKPENDERVAKYLYKIGIDCYDFPFLYSASFHRNLQDQIVLGYRVAGETRCDAEFKNSFIASITDRLVISSYEDRTLMEELAELSYKTRDYTEYLNDSDSINFDEERMMFQEDQMEPDWEENTAKIKVLENILFQTRGCPYTASGSLKLMKDYKEVSCKGK